MVYCNFEVIDDNKLVTTKDFYKKLKVKTYKCQKIKPEEYLRSKYILFSTYSQIMINREVLLVSGYPRSFDLSTKVFLPSDWDFNFMVSTRNEIYYINEILLQYRKHSSNNSANTLKVSEQLRMILNSYEKEYAGNEKVQQAIKYMRGKTCYFNIVYYIENGMKRKAFGNLLTYIGKYPVNIFCDFPWSFLLFFRILLPNRIDAYLKKLYLSS